MAVPALKQDRFTYQDYLEIEEQSDERHIFWDGEIFAMAGATIRHSVLETNLIVLLGTALRGRPCRPCVGNQRLRAPNSDRAVYADGIVVCGPPRPHPGDDNAVSNPVVIFEVLSKSTEAFDRGDKFEYYRTFPSVRTVVLISQKRHRVECYQRDERGRWSLSDLGEADELELPDVEARLSIRALYEGTEDTEGVE